MVPRDFRRSPTGIGILEIATGKLAANQTYRQMLGRSEEEMQSVGILDQ